MPESPMLTPEALEAAGVAAFPPLSRERRDARRNGDARAHAAVRAFLAAQDPEALAAWLYERNVVGPSLGLAVVKALLGGDDA